MRALKEYLTFTKGERNGIMLLLLLIVMLIIGININHYFVTNSQQDFSKFNQEVNDFLSHENRGEPEGNNYSSSDSSQYGKKRYPKNKYQKKKKRKVELFPFNPNKLDRASWKKLGLSDKQIDVIYKYEGKGGQFRRKEDVQKMFVVNDKLYEQWKPYINIEKQEGDETKEKKDFDSPKREYNKADRTSTIYLNTADTTDFKKLRGIGPAYSKRIVKYRSELGGFISIDQLKEVWGIEPEVIESNRERLSFDPFLVQKININTCTKEELKKHPYINWNLANSLISIRDKHGLYKTLDEIKRSDLVNDEIYRKIAPYLKVK
jgi:competence protein ComEA